MTFYNQSLMAVKEGRRLLADLNVPTQRPNDYFCENVKTDTHMNRVSLQRFSAAQHYCHKIINSILYILCTHISLIIHVVDFSS